jgi:hypothetical protein
MMKARVFISVFAATLLITGAFASYAQQSQAQEKGATGWNGGAKDQASQDAPKGAQGDPVVETTGQKVQIHDQAAAKDQPETATGEDLKGPPKRFAPSQTPE